MKLTLEKAKAMIYGHAVGDALGVPVEFTSRKQRKLDPVAEMRGFGSFPVPAGAWSDDTSMTLATLESLTWRDVDCEDIMHNFSRWLWHGEYTPTGVTFDVGGTTRQAIGRSARRIPAVDCGGKGEMDNGNGSLMRMAPVALHHYRAHGTELTDGDIQKVHDVSRITHAHPRSLIGCGIYVFIAVRLLDGQDVTKAVKGGVKAAEKYYLGDCRPWQDLDKYYRVLEPDVLAVTKEKDIKNSGYVVDTLEAAVWCLLTTDNYRDCVLRAVNLGGDTDTIAAIAGGLAGAAYGLDSIPPEWIATLLNKREIEQVCCGYFA